MPFVLKDDERRRNPRYPRAGLSPLFELVLCVAFVIAAAMLAANMGCR
jgi:hypothetical protein